MTSCVAIAQLSAGRKTEEEGRRRESPPPLSTTEGAVRALRTLSRRPQAQSPPGAVVHSVAAETTWWRSPLPFRERE